MSLKKFLVSLLALCPMVASAQHGFLGKHFLADVNVNTSSQWIRMFDYYGQLCAYDGLDDGGVCSNEYTDDSHYYVKSDGTNAEPETFKWWNFNVFFSANVEAILWKKGSLMLEARMNPYTDYYYQNENPFTGGYAYMIRKAQERSFEAGVGYRQYLFSSSNAPYGRYIQVGLNRLQVQWKHDCMNINSLQECVENRNSRKSYDDLYLTEEGIDKFRTEQKAGYENLWAPYFEFGYNYLLWHNRLRLSLSMRTEFPIGYSPKEADVDNPEIGDNAAYYAIRRFWSVNMFSLKAGVGFLIF